LSAWEAADHAARNLGLVLNEIKTSTPRILTYQASLAAVANREREVFQRLGVAELLDFDIDYLEIEGDPGPGMSLLTSSQTDGDEVGVVADAGADDNNTTVSGAQVEAAHEVFRDWMEEEEDDQTQRQDSAKVTATLLRRALIVFSKASDLSALDAATHMLVYEPSLTPTIARYVNSCTRADRQATRRALDAICKESAISPWQAVWVAVVAGNIPKAGTRKNSDHIKWLTHQMESRYQAVAAEATLALARLRMTSVDAVNNVLVRVSDVHRPTLTLALATLNHEAATRSAGSLLDGFRTAWGAEHF
jgi:hypothetical protein